MDKEPEITVSHADLDAALEERAAEGEAAEETVEEEPETPEKAISSEPDQDAEPEEDPEEEPEPVEESVEDPEEEQEEPDDHRERSKLGRRVSGLEQNISLLVDKIDQLVTARTEPEEDPEDDEPVFMTKKQLKEFVRSQAKDEVIQTKAAETKATQAYENAYVSQVQKVGANLPPRQLEAVFKEMFDNHNEIIHRIPEVDADINFHRAVASLAKKSKPAPKVVPLKKDAPKNLGGPADTIEAKKKVSPQKLDEHAAAFAKYHNLSDEKITEALSGETRPSLRGKFG